MSLDLESLARRVAAVVGPSSAATRALGELDQRRSRGESVGIWKDAGHWVVGPLQNAAPPSDATPQASKTGSTR